MEIRVLEKEIVDALIKIIKECDGDDLCAIAGEMIGGWFQWSDTDNVEDWGGENDIYLFTPDENYGGAFGAIEGERWKV